MPPGTRTDGRRRNESSQIEHAYFVRSSFSHTNNCADRNHAADRSNVRVSRSVNDQLAHAGHYTLSIRYRAVCGAFRTISSQLGSRALPPQNSLDGVDGFVEGFGKRIRGHAGKTRHESLTSGHIPASRAPHRRRKTIAGLVIFRTPSAGMACTALIARLRRDLLRRLPR